jgi:hypothetical protein
MLADRDFQDLDQEMSALAEEQTWGFFDAGSGVLVIANSLLIGYEITLSEKERRNQIYSLFVYEIFFLCCFICELAVRVCAGGFRTLFNPWNFFDLCLILVGFANNIVLNLLLWDGYVRDEEVTDVSFLLVFRTLRILRLVRLVRLVRLFRELTLIVSGIRHSWQLIFWTLWLISLAVYCFSIMLWDIGGGGTTDGGELSNALPNHFGQFRYTLATMWRFAIWDSWGGFARVLIFGCEAGGYSANLGLCDPAS